MKERFAIGILLGVLAAAAGGALWLWFAQSAPRGLGVRIPGEDGAPAATTSEAPVDLKGEFVRFDHPAPDLPGSWPCFRGADRDNISRESVPLADRWPSNGPPVRWSLELGEGYAGAAVHGGRVYVLDYDERKEGDALRCFSLEDGKELWRRFYRSPAKRNHGFSRTVPAVAGKYVVTVGPQCHALCCDATTGAFRWGIDLVRSEGAVVPLWYTGQCPLIDGTTAVLAPAGSNLLIGVDCESGAILWRSPNVRGWKMSHSSVVPMAVGGRKMFAYFAIGGIAGVAADGPRIGEVLWLCSDWAPPVAAPSPLPLGDGRVLLTAGYGAGSAMLRVEQTAGGFTARVVERWPRTRFACEQQTPILAMGHIWGILPKDAEALRERLVCMRPDGTASWNSGRDRRFGLGPFVMGDGKLFALQDEGMLTLLDADPSRYAERARAKVLSGREAWAPMALADGFLLLRDERRMLCLDVRRQGMGSVARAGTLSNCSEPVRAVPPSGEPDLSWRDPPHFPFQKDELTQVKRHLGMRWAGVGGE